MEIDLAPMMRKVASIWIWECYTCTNQIVVCPFCGNWAYTDQDNGNSIGLVHDEDCPASIAANWLKENNR